MHSPISSFDTPTQRSRNSRISIASRLFQYAISGTSHLDIPSESRPMNTNYNRLRNQLFPEQTIPSQRTRNQIDVSATSSSSVERTDAYYRRLRNRETVQLHPSFRLKAVCELDCMYCSNDICKRGMKAILLADTSV